MISQCISDDIPPQSKILYMVIPILMNFCSFVKNGALQAATKRDVINDVKLFPTEYHKDILSQIFDVI